MNTFEIVYKAVKKVPKGKVTTYGEIAKFTGIRSPRVVGFALHANKNPEKVPCHRVVKINGKLASGYAFGGEGIQKQLLIQEGVIFNNEYVDFSKSLFKFSE